MLDFITYKNVVPSYKINAAVAATIGVAKYGDYLLNTIDKAQQVANGLDKAANILEGLLPIEHNSLVNFTSAYTSLVKNDTLNTGYKFLAFGSGVAKFAVNYSLPAAGAAAVVMTVSYYASKSFDRSLQEAQSALEEVKKKKASEEKDSADIDDIELQKLQDIVDNLESRKYYSETVSSWGASATKFFITLYGANVATDLAIKGAKEVVNYVQSQATKIAEQGKVLSDQTKTIQNLQETIGTLRQEVAKNAADNTRGIQEVAQNAGDNARGIQDLTQTVGNQGKTIVGLQTATAGQEQTIQGIQEAIKTQTTTIDDLKSLVKGNQEGVINKLTTQDAILGGQSSELRDLSARLGEGEGCLNHLSEQQKMLLQGQAGLAGHMQAIKEDVSELADAQNGIHNRIDLLQEIIQPTQQSTPPTYATVESVLEGAADAFNAGQKMVTSGVNLNGFCDTPSGIAQIPVTTVIDLNGFPTEKARPLGEALAKNGVSFASITSALFPEIPSVSQLLPASFRYEAIEYMKNAVKVAGEPGFMKALL